MYLERVRLEIRLLLFGLLIYQSEEFNEFSFAPKWDQLNLPEINSSRY